MEQNKIWSDGPFFVYWNITKKCNFNCEHCHAVSSDGNELDFAQCKSVIDKMLDARVQQVIIAGGEPLLKEKIFELLNIIYSAGMRYSLMTNGYYVNYTVAKRLKELGVGEIQFSLDSYSREVHDTFRKYNGSFDHVINAIKLCGDNQITVGVNTVLIPENIRNIEKLGDLLNSLGVDSWRVTINIPKGKGKADYNKLCINSEILLEKLQNLKAKYKNFIIDDPLCVKFWGIDNSIAKQCGAGKIHCAIEANGDIKPCVFFDRSYGNIMYTDLLTIWRSEGMEKIRQTSPLYKVCSVCINAYKCKGGCRVFKNFYEENRLPNIFCFAEELR